jgi:hypothetical protein
MVVEWGSISGLSFVGLYSVFEQVACVGGTRPGQMGPGFGGCRRRTVTSGRSVGRGVVRRPRGGEVFLIDVCVWHVVVLEWVHFQISKWVARELSRK